MVTKIILNFWDQSKKSAVSTFLLQQLSRGVLRIILKILDQKGEFLLMGVKKG